MNVDPLRLVTGRTEKLEKELQIKIQRIKELEEENHSLKYKMEKLKKSLSNKIKDCYDEIL